MILPNVVVAGAPRCGTTSLFEYLSDHPEVCASRVKETYYFMDQDYPLYRKTRPNFHENGLAGYGHYFEHCSSSGAKIILEATPDYLYQRTALEALPALSPPVTLLFMLRKPSDRVYSLFKFAQNNLATLPQSLAFREFLEMIQEPDNPLFADRPILRSAVEHSKYIQYLIPYKRACQPDQIKVYILERLLEDPLGFMGRVCMDLGIDAGFFGSYPLTRRNQSFRVRNQFLHRTRRSVKRILPGLLVKLTSALNRGYHILNIERGIEKSADDLECLASLDTLFKPFNDRLSAELGVDVLPWE